MVIGRTRIRPPILLGMIVGHIVGQAPRGPKSVPIRSPISCSSRSQGYLRVSTRALLSDTYRNLGSLITQRSLVQIQPPQPIDSRAGRLYAFSASFPSSLPRPTAPLSFLGKCVFPNCRRSFAPRSVQRAPRASFAASANSNIQQKHIGRAQLASCRPPCGVLLPRNFGPVY